jgi:Bacterial Ig-like domain (group 3)
MRNRLLSLIALSALCAVPTWAQHTTANLTQTVSQRGTILQLTSPTTGPVPVGTNVSYSALLSTAGAPVVTSESINFADGATALGSSPITAVTTTNLLPWSENFSQWSPIANGAAAPTLSMTATAPDGTANRATFLTFPATSGSATSGISYSVSGGASYAGLPLTISVFTQGTTAGSITLNITDGSQSVATGSAPCAFSTSVNRCNFTYTLPVNAAAGYTVSFTSSNSGAQSPAIWGASLEQAATMGPYVQTVGQSASGQGGLATFSTANLLDGTHSITASYGGDSNFIASTSQPVAITVSKGTAAITLTQDSTSTAFGAAVTFTATVSGPDTMPTGTVTFMDGATAIGTGTLNASGVATFATTTLAGGSHTITAVYSGDTNFNTVSSSAVTHAVTPIAATMAVTSSENPSVYGDGVTLTITMTGTGGIVPTGTVTVMDGTTNLGTLTLSATGTATLQSSALNAGTHNLTITYSGDSSYN